MSEWIVIIDAGHGGILPSGKYATAPAKMHDHGKPVPYSDGGVVYEGVLNRLIAGETVHMLRSMGINAIRLTAGSEDTPLTLRANIVNQMAHANGKRVLFISEHCNASKSHKAKGFEIYTSPGFTQSDLFASAMYDEVRAMAPEVNIRSDYSDSDADKESVFWVLVQTICPALLVENCFFDNLEDLRLFANDEYRHRLTLAKCTGILRTLKNI